MHEYDPTLADALAKADEPALREILREAEAFIESQLQTALAADQRALTFAGILAAALAIILGAAATIGSMKMALLVAPMAACFVAALHCAAKAAEPCRFEFVGNDPSEWRIDVTTEKPLTRSLAEQAAFYSSDIKNNSDAMERSTYSITSAAAWAFIGVLFGTGAAVLSVLAAYWPST